MLGAAWMTGALPAVQELLRCQVGEVDVLLGTSAGSVLAAALRCGVSIEEMIAYQHGEPVGPLAGIADIDGGPWPRPPKLRFGSPRLMMSALTAPHRTHPTVAASAWLPVGRERHRGLHNMVQLLHAHAESHARRAGSEPFQPAEPWPAQPESQPAQPELQSTQPESQAARPTASDWFEHGQTWIVAVDYDSGSRTVFGRAGAPQASLADAVVASCSIPGWYEPMVIGGRRYVDGGVRSSTSLGLLADAGIDEVCVLAPMASLVRDNPRKPHTRIERRMRALITYSLQREVRALRAAGMKVTVVTPGPEDLAVMGLNPMDPRRRAAVLETSLRTSPRTLASAGRQVAHLGPPRTHPPVKT